IVQAAFAVVCCAQLRRWVDWHRQRRVLAVGLAAALLAPFAVYLLPARSLDSGGPPLGLKFSLAAMLVLGPCAIALLPGIARGAPVAKLLMPGRAAPGWVMAAVAPLAAVLAYVVLIQPYQLSGTGFFAATVLALVAAAAIVGRDGWQLARPL